MKNLVLVFTFVYSLWLVDASAQLRGVGIDMYFGRAVASQGWNNIGARRATGFGVFYEHAGFLSNFKHHFGVVQVPYVAFTDTVGMAYTRIQQAFNYQLQWKYWISNAMRAKSIHGIKCAHRMKIREDYTFKVYTILALNNSFLLKRGDSGNQFSRYYALSAMAGLGANLLKFSGGVMYLEGRGYRQMTPLFRDGVENKFRSYGIEFCLGFKVIMESGKPSW